LFFNYIIKNQSIDKCDISPVNWVYPILTGHIYVLWAIQKKKKDMTLNDLISTFGKDNLFKWFFELPNFYLRPTKYFKQFFLKSKEEKISISFIYTFTIVILLYVFSESSIKEITKVMIIEIGILFIAFSILYVNKSVLDSIFKTKTKTSNIIYFLLITKILSIPFQLTFYFLFEKTEMYEFLLIHNSIIVLLLIFVVMYSNKILYDRIYQILIGIVLNLILYNGFIISIQYLRFDKYVFNYENPLFVDPVYKEFETKLLTLDSLTNELPREKFLLKIRNEHYLTYTFEKDSISSIVNKINTTLKKGNSFKINILTKLNKNTITVDSLKYHRNKELYSELMKYLYCLKYEIRNPINSSKTFILDQSQIHLESGEYYGEIKHLSINNELYVDYIAYLRKRNDFINASNISDYPMSVLMLIFYPAYLLTGK
jgi:hypothetical protein